MTAPIFYPLLSAVPMGVLAALVKAWRWLHEAKGLRVPLREKLLRPPGESVRRKKEDLDDRIIDSLVYVVGIPPTLLICYLVMTRTAPAPSGGFWALFLFMAVAGYGVLVVRLLALLESRANQRSCFGAEKSVGEDLNRLMAGGWQVFHDFPLDAKDNISHIVVAPCGVFSVETRTRLKGDPARRQKAHEVIYDGKGLQFPGHYDKENLIQARNHAKSLSALLGHALGATILVKPVLTFPGWTVTTKTPGDVLVVNPKAIRSAITSDAQPVLSEDQMRQIADQLDQKCRDVEF